MIIVISNRNVQSQYNDERIFGNSTSDEGLKLAEFHYLVQQIDDEFDWDVTDDFDDGEPEETWQPTVYSSGQEHQLFEKLVNSILEGRDGAGRPWLMFLHGNNQDMRSNLVKCRKLKQIHDVNVIAFSWPSQPHTFVQNAKRAARDMLSPLDIKHIIEKSSPGPAAMGFSFFKELAKKKKQDYEEAKVRAIATAPKFVKALTLIKTNLIDKLAANGKTIDFSLLVHSLGNHVFENTQFPSNGSLNGLFTNVIMHQADVHSTGHSQWIAERMLGIGKNAYVTVNYYDWVLWLSSLANEQDRLGMSRQELSAPNTTYFDMTEGVNVDNRHNFFHMKKMQNPAINGLFNHLLRSQSDLNYNQLGFEKSPIGDHVYKLRELATDEDWGD